MRWTPSPPSLIRAFETATTSLRGIERRKMFGYPAVFVNGNMFTGLVRDAMVLRLREKDRAALLALPGAKPFVAMRGRVMKAWALVPPAMTRSPARLRPWLRRALACGRALPPKMR